MIWIVGLFVINPSQNSSPILMAFFIWERRSSDGKATPKRLSSTTANQQ